MGFVNKVRSMIGGEGSSAEDGEARDPSHLCQSCGEEYFVDPSIDIDSCRACGGIKVEAVD